jgi:opacity protein-like surface antigen
MRERSAQKQGPMNTRIKLAVAVSGCLLALGVTSTTAAQTFEITPFGGWRFGGGFSDLETGADLDLDDSLSYGVILSIPWNDPPRSRVELIWSRQDTTVSAADAAEHVLDLDVQYLHIGGMVPFKTPNDRLETLISGGLGATFMRPGTDGAGSETLFSLSVGVGLLYRASDHIGIRLEARGYYTFTEADAAIFCAGGCVIAFSANGFAQGDLTAGLQLSF